MVALCSRKSQRWQLMTVSGFSCPPPVRGLRQRANSFAVPLLVGISEENGVVSYSHLSLYSIVRWEWAQVTFRSEQHRNTQQDHALVYAILCVTFAVFFVCIFLLVDFCIIWDMSTERCYIWDCSRWRTIQFLQFPFLIPYYFARNGWDFLTCSVHNLVPL